MTGEDVAYFFLVGFSIGFAYFGALELWRWWRR